MSLSGRLVWSCDSCGSMVPCGDGRPALPSGWTFHGSAERPDDRCETCSLDTPAHADAGDDGEVARADADCRR
jgi:hypothetical protein